MTESIRAALIPSLSEGDFPPTKLNIIILKQKEKEEVDKTVLFPSKEWFDKLYEIANADKEYKEVGKDWEGDFLVKTSLDEDSLKDLADEKHIEALMNMLTPVIMENLDAWKGTPMGNMIEKVLGMSLDDVTKMSPDELSKKMNPKEMAERYSKLTPEDLKGVELCTWIDFWHGGIRSPIEIVPPKVEKKARFTLSGPYKNMKELVSGKTDSIRMVMSGKLKLAGDMSYMMRHMKAVTRTSALLGMIPTE